MSWNECLYHYHLAHGGQFLAGEDDDGLLILTWKDRPLAVDLSAASAGRGGTFRYVRARAPVTLAKPYRLTIGAEKALSGGMNTLLRAVPGLTELSLLPADVGYPEVTKKRLIRTDNVPFTKLVLGSLDFRNALLACPEDKVEIRPGPGGEGLHLVAVTTATAVGGLAGDGGGWCLDTVSDYEVSLRTEEELAQIARRAEEEFFPRMDRFLELARAACAAVTQWAM